MLFMTHEHETHLSGSTLRLNALPPEWGQGLYTIKLQAKQIYSGPGYQKKKKSIVVHCCIVKEERSYL